MNYFAHAIRFLDQPLFAVATGLPDMLSVVDRSMRLRSKKVSPFVTDSDPVRAEIARGVLQHLSDDDWFHTTPACVTTMADLTRVFRRALPQDDSPRCSFLGHITTELLLDRALIEAHPERLDRYYELLREVDAESVEAHVNVLATKTTDRLARLIRGFAHEQFLRSYLHSESLRFRLNQVMLRVGLAPLPESICEALDEAWDVVRQRVDGLLPSEFFHWPAA